jgi:GAF domain-containing protein
MTTTDSFAIGKLDLTALVNGFRNAWERLGRPAERVTAFDERRQAKLISWTTATLAMLAAIGALVAFLFDPTPNASVISKIVLTAVLSGAYAISRTKYYSWASVLAVSCVAALPIAFFVFNGDFSESNTTKSLLWSLVALLLAALFFQARGIIITVASILIGLATVAIFIPEVTVPKLFAILSFTLLSGALAVAGQRHRDLLEKERQAGLIDSNLELQRLSTLLEKRVTEFTRDLVLAAEVGRTVSQVRDLDALLADATELIRDRFNLYYVQVYMADAKENNLILRTGTGAVGKELVKRGHRLLFGPGSINGLAAGDKQPVVVPDTDASAVFRPNRLLPDTRSELAVPLLLGQRVVGVLDLQSNRPGTFTHESLPPFATLASQLAIAIENATLFTDISQARIELEAQMAKQTGEDWRGFLDAIRRGHWSGFVYQDGGTQPLAEPLPGVVADATLAAPFTVSGVLLGEIQLERGRDGKWTESDEELVSLVASEAAQRVENLRLLVEAEQYRVEAEEAARRLIRKGWEEHLHRAGSPGLGYVYDQKEVSPATVRPDDDSLPPILRPLTIGDVSIGQLAVSDLAIDEESATQLMATISHQLSAHIENLRLSEQTERALSVTEKQAHRLAMLNKMSEELNRAPAIDNMYLTAVEQVGHILASDRATLTMVTPAGDAVELLAIHGEAGDSSIGDMIPIKELSTFDLAIRERKVVVVSEGAGDGLGGIRSYMVAPLVGEKRVIGTINVGSKNPDAYASTDESLIMQIGAMLGATIERRVLAEQAQARAERERILREITARVSGSADVDTVMRTAVSEIGRALGRRAFVYLSHGEFPTQPPEVENGT